MHNNKTIFLAVSAIFVEWLEFSIFIYLSTVISDLFFPNDREDLALIKTFGIFAISYFVRPIGAIIYGYVADQKGRKIVMLFSVFLMSLSTFAIGFLPTYAEAGVIAPISLMILRMVQGFAIAVEFNNSGNYLIEHFKERRVVASSLLVASSTFGMCVGAFAVSHMDLVTYPWLWRVPFIATALASFAVFLLRKNMEESPEFLNIKKNNFFIKNPITELFKCYKRRLIIIAAFSAFIGVILYGGHIYLTSAFLIKHGGYSHIFSIKIAFYTQLALAITVPIMAIIGEHYNCYNLLARVGIIILGCVCPLLFYFGNQGPDSLLYLSICLAIYVISDAMFVSSAFYYMYALLPTNIRCTGTGLAYSAAAALFGGSAPALSEKLVQINPIAPGLYISLIALVTYYIYGTMQSLTLFDGKKSEISPSEFEKVKAEVLEKSL